MSLSHECNFFFLQTPRGLLPRLKSRFWCSSMTSGQTTVQKELCRKSCAERAMRSEVCPALLCNSCPGQAVPQQCWRLSATDLCATRNSCSHQTRSLTMNRGGDSGGTFWQPCLHPCLPHFHPQLLADLDLWSSLPLMKLGGILLCP